ncbi:MAG: hypothetical protein KIT16_17500 [Rhodospirillaceae bacterium]|nr:hypothetical protein [Rhodospirillaceae bacterium]
MRRRRPAAWRLLLGAAWTLALMVSATGAFAESAAPVDRIVIGLYDGKTDLSLRRSRIHRLVEMPLNHLGLVVVAHDVRSGLPAAAAMRGVRGIVTWFTGIAFDRPGDYLDWLDAQTRNGAKLVMIDHPGIDPGALAGSPHRKFESVLSRLGLRWEDEWVALTYSAAVTLKDSAMVEFERPLPKPLPPYQRLRLLAGGARVHLALRRGDDALDSPLVVTGPGGGYVAGGYAVTEPPRDIDTVLWQIDPFRFFRAAFATDDLPKLDTTTMSGRRLYYSHVDGDGWNNVSSAMRYLGQGLKSAEVLLKDVLLRTPDLPVTVAPITGDLEDSWYGDDKARELAREIFALPQVEAASHTHSHPFVWGFFRDPDPRKEVRYLPFYPPRPGRSMAESVWNPKDVPGASAPGPKPDDEIPHGYRTPRSYAVRPFDLASEVAGSLAALQPLLPPGKRVLLYQWSGDTSPFERILAAVEAAGLRNINGGDSRMDGPYASYAQVAPLALRVGRHLQIYSSASNENTYTDNWRRRFFGFRVLAETMAKTESPIRVKPINIYYHVYSVEREEGLTALWSNIDYARRQEIAPIAASRFVAMVEGFMAARIEALGPLRWRIDHRGAVETVRFDHASLLAVDFARARGVVGQRRFQGSLYVALDGAVADPVVALAALPAADPLPKAARPYLVQGRWRVAGLLHGYGFWRFHAEGFGAAAFAWKTPWPGRYIVTGTDAEGRSIEATATADTDGLLRFRLELDGIAGADFTVKRTADGD